MNDQEKFVKIIQMFIDNIDYEEVVIHTNSYSRITFTNNKGIRFYDKYWNPMSPEDFFESLGKEDKEKFAYNLDLLI